MKNRQLSNQLLVTMVLVCSCQQIWAGLVVKGGGGKSKNSTTTSKELSQTTKQPKIQHKAKTTTTTTNKPELETTTLPNDLDLDGRSAFINNQYVADAEEPLPDTSPPLYELLQQQMETVLSNTGGNIQVYNNNSPQMKEALDNGGSETQKPPGKPIFGYDLGQFDDYDEEEGNEYASEGDYMPDNCEDTQESLLGDNDADSNGYAGAAQLTHTNLPALQNNNYGQGNLDNKYEQSSSNKPYDSSNYAPQGNTNQGTGLYSNKNQNKQNELNNYGTQSTNNQVQSGQLYGNNKLQNNYGTTQTEATQQHHYQQNNNNNNNNNYKPTNKPATKPKPSTSHNTQNNYGQLKPHEQYQNTQQSAPTNHYGQPKPLDPYAQNNQKPLTNQKPLQNQRPSYNAGKTPQNSYNNQKPSGQGNNKPYTKPSTQQTKPIYNKPGVQGFNNKPTYANNYPTATSNSPNNSYNNNETLTSAYGNFNPITTSSYTADNTNSLNPSLTPNFSYGNSNAENLTPFSTTSAHHKYPQVNGQKRHLTFRTVSSSTQYVATPLADLMFKFSIGMAKPSNGKLSQNSVNNQAQVFNVLNDIDAKTE